MNSLFRRSPHARVSLTPQLLRFLLTTAMSASPAVMHAQKPGRQPVPTTTVTLSFDSHDGYPFRGKLTRPAEGPLRGVVVYVQSAEGMTIDMKRADGRGGTFNYFDLYREELPRRSLAFFSYEGRGITLGDNPPRYEQIDTAVYNTSTLENKARDVLAAVRALRTQPGFQRVPILLLGASEGSLIGAEAAARAPGEIAALAFYGVMAVNMRDVFRHIMTDGAFIVYKNAFDADGDGIISSAEFDADPAKYRASALRNAPFTAFDANGDGSFTSDEMAKLTRPYVDAIDSANFTLLDQWAKTAAGVSTPRSWFADHFAHAPMWTFLEPLDLPIGLFQGEMDAMTPAHGVHALEQLAMASGRKRMEFHYYRNLDHSLGVGPYFRNGVLPRGHEEIFDFLERVSAVPSTPARPAKP